MKKYLIPLWIETKEHRINLIVIETEVRVFGIVVCRWIRPVGV